MKDRLKNMSYVKLLIFIFSIWISACGNYPMVFDEPRNQMDDFCSGWFVNTPSTCIVPSNANVLSQIYSETGPALILVTEPGNLSASAENLRIMSQSFPAGLKPYFRKLQNNLLTAYLSLILRNNGRKYSRIYVIRSDAEIKSSFLTALSEITKKHSDVDLLLGIHGNKSSWALDPTLTTLLTSDELIAFAGASMNLDQRRKIRSVFSTACYANSRLSSLKPSMSEAVVRAFPRAVTYGSIGVNSAQVHRDFIAFETYYKGSGFATSVLAGNEAVQMNYATGDRRINLNFPMILGYGCGTYSQWWGSYTDCGSRILNVPTIPFYDYQLSDSLAQLAMGPEANLNTTIGAGSFPEIQPGYFLMAGQCTFSGSVHLCMQTDGNLAVYASPGNAVWATSWYPQNNAFGFTGTTGGLSCAGCYMYFQYDGNLVLYNPSFNGNPWHAYWASNTQGANSKLSINAFGNSLQPVVSIRNALGAETFPTTEDIPYRGIAGGFTIQANQCHSAGTSHFCMQADGNLVFYIDGAPVWATSWLPENNALGFDGITQGLNCSQCSAVFQADGNLVLYNPQFNGNQYHAYWASNTYAANARLILSKMESPYVRIYRPDVGVIFPPPPPPPPPDNGGGY